MVEQLQAITDRVIIRLEKEQKTTNGGIMLTDWEDESPNTGTVESVGELVKSVKVGDRVIFHRFDEIPILEPNLAVVRERSLLGIIQ